ncbi:MAG: hypothetical protein CMN29_26785 [Sandaracinus sp.]|nr:hypothetical protein [Myxococcales bacterium]MAT28521.1 hypothetical protein [Sandaracinus sp.]
MAASRSHAAAGRALELGRALRLGLALLLGLALRLGLAPPLELGLALRLGLALASRLGLALRLGRALPRGWGWRFGSSSGLGPPPRPVGEVRARAVQRQTRSTLSSAGTPRRTGKP